MSTHQSHAPAGVVPRRAPALRYDTRLNSSDTVLWNIERDPTLRTTIVAVAVLDRAPDWHRLRDRIMDAATDVPRLRQRVTSSRLGTGPLRWEDDPHFDIEFHLRELALPAPGTREQLGEQVARIHARQLDRSRPLWEAYVITGLEGGKAAFYSKIHHAAIDGVSGNAGTVVVPN